jgi:hypothetical protein
MGAEFAKADIQNKNFKASLTLDGKVIAKRRA